MPSFLHVSIGETNQLATKWEMLHYLLTMLEAMLFSAFGFDSFGVCPLLVVLFGVKRILGNRHGVRVIHDMYFRLFLRHFDSYTTCLLLSLRCISSHASWSYY